jgi:ABC-type glycerol-3-phosphate transport system permease component
MAATAVMALVPAFLLALFRQKYVIRGLHQHQNTKTKTGGS